MRLLQGVAWNELLIRIPLSPVLPILILWELVWVGVSLRFIYCSLNASAEQVVPLVLLAMGHISLVKEAYPQIPRTLNKGVAVK